MFNLSRVETSLSKIYRNLSKDTPFRASCRDNYNHFFMKKLRLLAAAAVIGAPFSAAADPSLTIYNQNFAVVRDLVPLDLKEGDNPVTYTGATLHLEPDSVVLRDPSGKTDLRILEQSYRGEVVSQGLLLSLNEGKEIEFLKQPGSSF